MIMKLRMDLFQTLLRSLLVNNRNYLHVTRRRLSPHTVGSMEEKIGQTHGPSVIGTGDFLVSPSLQRQRHLTNSQQILLQNKVVEMISQISIQQCNAMQCNGKQGFRLVQINQDKITIICSHGQYFILKYSSWSGKPTLLVVVLSPERKRRPAAAISITRTK